MAAVNLPVRILAYVVDALRCTKRHGMFFSDSTDRHIRVYQMVKEFLSAQFKISSGVSKR